MPQRTRSKDYKHVYTNTVNEGFSALEYSLTFGHASLDVDGQQVIEELMTVSMSPQHLKVLAGALDNAIRRYEAQYGTIPTESGRKAD